MDLLFSHLIGGDPTFLGWVITTLYLILVFRCATKLQAARNQHDRYLFWLTLLIVFLLLGVNKQLDLQTPFLIHLKILAVELGLLSQKLLLKLTFLLFAACFLLLLIWVGKRELASSIRRYRIVWLGLLLLFAFIFTRAVIFNRLFSADDQLANHWSTKLELLAQIVILVGSFRGKTFKPESIGLASAVTIDQAESDALPARCPQCGQHTIAKAVANRVFKCKKCSTVFTVHK